MRQFLLTNLIQKNSDSSLSCRLPLDILLNSMDNIGDFPYDPDDGVTFIKPTLFIKGGDSKHINRRNIPIGETFFPSSSVKTIDGAGHWGKPKFSCSIETRSSLRVSSLVQSEKPREFVEIVNKFCAGQ